MITKQIDYAENLESLQAELADYEASVRTVAATIKALEKDPGQKGGKRLVMWRKVLNREMNMIRLYKSHIAKIKKSRPVPG